MTIRHRASGEFTTSGVRPEQDGFEWHVWCPPAKVDTPDG